MVLNFYDNTEHTRCVYFVSLVVSVITTVLKWVIIIMSKQKHLTAAESMRPLEYYEKGNVSVCMFSQINLE